MEQKELSVLVRHDKGKGAARKLRREGLIPAIIYGKGATPAMLAIDPRELRRALRGEAGANVLLSLRGGEVDGTLAMVKDLQTGPVRGELLHADLVQVRLHEKVTATVPLHFTGTAEGVKLGGILQAILRSLELRCLPAQIPEFIEVDVSALGVGDTLHVKDLKVGEGLELVEAGQVSVVTVLAPQVEEVKPAEKVAPPEEAPEAKETPE